MLENHMIQSRGFKNVSHLGQVMGFQVKIRIKYYRGIFVSLIEGAEVAVDGQSFERNQIRWTIGNHTFTQDELGNVTDVHWQWTEPATLTISKPGGLKPGNHTVRVSMSYRTSYMGEGASNSTFSRELILVE
jgi:hypothetical protein